MSILKQPNTVVELNDGEIATTCYNGLDGIGVKFGEHHFDLSERGFSDNFPEPDEIIKDTDNRITRIIREGGWDDT